MPQTLYEVIWIFIIYAFIGWCTEVSYAALETGKFVNRGFLNGPYCPIYGSGVLTVVILLTPLKYNLLILYIGSFILTTIIEFITGFILEKAFHNKWWDYSNKPYNIMGYVCLKFSIFWGLACTFIMLIIHPIIFAFVEVVPQIIGIILLSIIMTAFVIDGIVTVTSIIKFNKRLKLMDDIAAKIKIISNQIGENIYENVTDAIEKKETFEDTHVELINNIVEKKAEFNNSVENIKLEASTKKQQIAETVTGTKEKMTESISNAKSNLKKEHEDLIKKYKELIEKKEFGTTRLMKAFPEMKSRDSNETLQKLKHLLNIKNK